MKTIRCSSLPQLAICPGAFAACDGLKSQDSAQSLAGSAGHVSLQRYWDQAGHVTGEEVLPVGDFCQTLDAMTAGRACWYAGIIHAMIEDNGGAGAIHTEGHIERNITEEVRLSGHFDLVVICGNGKTILCDYKFNFLEVDRASENVQLMGYAWLLSGSKFYGGGNIVCLLTAGGNDEPFTAAEYTDKEIKAAGTKLHRIAANVSSLNAIRVASPKSCKYCQAAGTTRCPESCEEVLALPVIVERFEVLPPMDDCRKLFEAIKVMESFKDKFLPMLKEAVESSPEAWGGLFELSDTGSTRTIKDAQEAYKTLVDDNGVLTAQEFLRCVSVPITGIEKAAKERLKAAGVAVKDQKAHLAGLLGDNLELKEKAKSLKMVTKQQNAQPKLVVGE